MIKVFEKNKNGKIQFSIQELEKILNEAYWEGYNYASRNVWTYTTPNYWTGTSPYIFTSNASSATITGTITNNTTNTNTLEG